LFEPFFSSESRSSGLGLYICRELCERYGALIGYQRVQRGGTEGNEFFVMFKPTPPAPRVRHLLPQCPPKNLFNVFLESTSTFSGWDARRGAPPIARLWASAATPQTARKGTCPKGWSEIGRLDAPVACMGISPCGASEASTHPDCTPMRPPKRH
jgi:hypothetical protein